MGVQSGADPLDDGRRDGFILLFVAVETHRFQDGLSDSDPVSDQHLTDGIEDQQIAKYLAITDNVIVSDGGLSAAATFTRFAVGRLDFSVKCSESLLSRNDRVFAFFANGHGVAHLALNVWIANGVSPFVHQLGGTELEDDSGDECGFVDDEIVFVFDKDVAFKKKLLQGVLGQGFNDDFKSGTVVQFVFHVIDLRDGGNVMDDEFG